MSGAGLIPDPNPYAALRRLLAMPAKVRRSLLRLEVWCEDNECTPVRVFALREGTFVQCRSDADVSDIPGHYPREQKWSPRSAFFVEEWLAGSPESRLQVVCDCRQTTTRLVNVQRLIDAIPAPGTPTRRITLPLITVQET